MNRIIAVSFLIGIISAPAARSQTEAPLSERQMTIKMCRDLLREAVAQMDSSNYDKAVVYLDSVFQCDPANPDAFYFKAMILGWKADTAGVMKLLETGIEKAPISTRLKVLLARYLISRGFYDGAFDQIENVLAIKPRDGEALYLKGIILQARNDTTGAVEIYKKALDISIGRTK